MTTPDSTARSDSALGGVEGVDYDDDCGECWNCGGEGFVYGCSWDWQCDTWDGDSCLCTRPCHICHPPKDDPEMRRLMGELLATPKDETPNTKDSSHG